MINIFLRGKYFWEAGDPRAALQLLDGIMSAHTGRTSFYLPDGFIEHHRNSSFENAVSIILLDDSLLIAPFSEAFENLWNTFPAQYMIRALDDSGQVLSAKLRSLLNEAAARGLLSDDYNDYDLSGRVVVRGDDCPQLWAQLEVDSLSRAISDARQTGAWRRFALESPDLTVSLFLYAIFHKERALHKEMVLIRLERMTADHLDFIRFSADVLERHADRVGHEEAVHIGMRLSNITDTAKCLRDFVAAIRSTDFERFLDSYVPDM